jgi:hypothetical protein
MTTKAVMPRHEPEVMRANGRRYATECNRVTRKPYGKAIYQALELAEKAYNAHRLPYIRGISHMSNFPPDRFTWLCDEHCDAKQCLKVRDDETDMIALWPHWRG